MQRCKMVRCCQVRRRCLEMALNTRRRTIRLAVALVLILSMLPTFYMYHRSHGTIGEYVPTAKELSLLFPSMNKLSNVVRISEQSAIFDNDILADAAQRMHDLLYENKTGEQCTPRLPKCIIIGVGKSGTRPLIDFMAIHPNVVIKGRPDYRLDYFLMRNKSMDWYQSQMPCSYSDQITVTTNPIYFYNDIAERLYNYSSTLKIILIVREPVERSVAGLSSAYFSQHWKRGEQNISEMPAVDDQLVKRAGKVNERNHVIQVSKYHVHVKRYLKYFPRDQLLILDSAELGNTPAIALNRVESFLGLKHAIFEDMFVYSHVKQHYCLRMEPAGMACYQHNRGRKNQKQIHSNTSQTLKQYFHKHNEALLEVTGVRFDWS